MCFSRESQRFLIFLGIMQGISALDTNIDNFQQISVKYLPFPHSSISLMTKDFAQNKAYNYFSTGDAKALV